MRCKFVSSCVGIVCIRDQTCATTSNQTLDMHAFVSFAQCGSTDIQIIPGPHSPHHPSRFRIFSVDGSHTAEATRVDLANAAACMVPGGVIILDDVFNPDWPGVAEGLHAYMAEPSQPLAAFAVAFNKVSNRDLPREQQTVAGRNAAV